MKILRNESGILLSQEHYVEKILKKFGHLEDDPLSTPYDSSVKLAKHNGEPVAQSEYAQIIGSLLHLINFTWPDIAYAVCRLSRYTHCPGSGHWEALVRVLRYLRGTMNFGILYSGFSAVLEGYSDANWVSDSDETKSTSGYVFTLGGGAITWKSVRQTILTKSSRDSEFIAMELAGTEAEWLKNFLADIPISEKPTPSVSLHCDNQSAIVTAKNKTFNGKSRHIRLRHNIIRQLLKNGVISIDYVRSEVNLADPFTKPLGKKQIIEISRGWD